ncbi:MAG: hypothetical protein HZA95_01320 [Candidatus Vogelbacteria bacterium]|nr:hypothetical protein [Candidatus Vogelbacteria bacterium]
MAKRVFNETQEYRKWETIPLGIFDVEEWYAGEAVSLFNLTKGECYGRPLFIYEPGLGVSIWYNWSDTNQWGSVKWKKYLQKHMGFFNREEIEYRKACAQIMETVRIPKFPTDFIKLHKLTLRMWPMLAFSNTSGNQVEIDKSDLTRRAYEIRASTDRVSYAASEAMHHMAAEALPEKYKQHKDFLTYKEIVSGKIPSMEEVEKRKRGYVYFEGKLHVIGLVETGELFSYNNVVLLEDKVFPKKEFTGSVAYKGKVKGIVQKLQDMNDFKKDFTGKILVASMTTPDYLAQMKQSAAFITDEGGITCHAAIVARELKKPCIIGTKIATKVLKDGDLVEVDADRGIVRKL